MNYRKGWIIGMLSVMLVVAYACRDRVLDSAGSQQEQSEAIPQKLATQAPSWAGQDQQNFRAHLKGRNEVPPVETKAQGQALFTVSSDGSSIHYKLIASNIENVFMAHIHNAPAGENGGVVVWLYPSAPPPQLIEGRFQGVLAEGTITASNLVGSLAGKTLSDLIDIIKAGNAYVNVHTTQHRSGEIRGQIF